MSRRREPRQVRALFAGALLALTALAGCRAQTRIEPARSGWAHRGGSPSRGR